VPGEYAAFSQGNNQSGLGTVARFSVAGGAAGGSLPRSDSSILMYDYGFKVPGKIDGNGVLRIDNIGENQHFIVGIRLNPGVSPRAARRALVTGQDMQGPPPGELVSVVGLVSPGSSNLMQASLKPGVYVIACFYADAPRPATSTPSSAWSARSPSRGRAARHRSAARRRPRSVPYDRKRSRTASR
jgi:hypothetical protein